MNGISARNSQLDPQKIIETIQKLEQRVQERFPGSGLGRVVGEVLHVANECVARAAWIRKPHVPLRVGVGVLVLAIVSLLVRMLFSLDQFQIREFANFLQVLDSGMTSLVFIGGAILFLLTWETRTKRTRALRALHELRALAHTVDMHQLTKDPDRYLRAGPDTPSSPKRKMTAFELNRYLDYCSETLALISKIAALYAQSFEDPVLLDAVDDVENLASTLSRTIWQKITILDRMAHAAE